ncbi:MAG TPA: substrate-binding domain-containing protein [Candidatus Dorea gallistercoris]|uniref:Substrate-binding domain-containing protein n=1 Tax=Candidatus Dorea gallistercoris TaxID=2838542 RepID=A0A9D1UEQ2_9FIRM|nr:substrate-binding domain-containing protein [Candidatus Dorea gallistercoris]
MKKKWSMAVLALCTSLLLAACGEGGGESVRAETEDGQTSGEEKESNASEEPEYQAKLDAVDPAAYGNAKGLTLEKGAYISIIGKTDGGQYWEEVKEGTRQAAADINAELGYEGEDQVRVTYSGPAESDNVDEQVNILDEELARYPVALGIAITDAQACDVQFDLAAESDIPVVAFDSGSDYQGLMATVATDNPAAAAYAADQMAELTGGSGQIAVFAQDSKSQSALQRVNGFVSRLQQQYPDIQVISVYYMDQLEAMGQIVADEINAGTYQRPGADSEMEQEVTAENITEEDVMDYIFAKYPEIKGCYGTSGEAVELITGTLDRLEKEDMAVLGFDADEEEVTAMEEGKIDGLVVQNPFGMGYAAVIASARAACDLNNEAYVNTGYVWMTPDNMDSEEIQAMLY